MTKIHSVIISALRTHLRDSAFAEHLTNWTDDQLVRRIFSNYRDGHGLRLTSFGQQMMQSCFASFDFATEEQHHQRGSYILFMDRQCKMPYYWDNEKLVVYDKKFAAWLGLVDGHIESLLTIDLE